MMIRASGCVNASIGTMVLVLAGLVSASAQQKPSTAELLEGTILDSKQQKKILAGEKVAIQAHEASPREMAVLLSCLISPGRKGTLATLRTNKPVMPEEYRDASGAIDLEDIEGSLGTLTIGDKAKSEAKRYLEAQPGWELSLSTEEIAAFRALDPPEGEGVAAVEAQLRRMFAERLRAYRSEGLSGIADFDRGRGQVSSVAEDLNRTTLGAEGFKSVLPKAHRALLDYPGEAPPDGESFYFWTRLKILGRPVFMLNERLAGSFDGAEVVIDRQIYTTQFLGGGQTVTAMVPVQEGTLVFYVNHTFVDRWTGPSFATGAKRAVGLRIIDNVLKEMANAYGLCEGVH